MTFKHHQRGTITNVKAASSLVSGRKKRNGIERGQDITLGSESENTAHLKMCSFSEILECLLRSATGECLTSRRLLILELDEARRTFLECSPGHPAFDLMPPSLRHSPRWSRHQPLVQQSAAHQESWMGAWLAGLGCTQLSEEDSGLGERVLKNYIRLAESQRKSLASVICPRWPDHCVRFNPYTNLLKY